MTGLGKRDRRALMAGGALVLGTLGWFRGLPALQQWRSDSRGASVEMMAAVHGAELVLEQFPEVSDSVAVRSEQLVGFAPLVFAAGGAAGPGATLASHVGNLARVSGVRFGSISILPDTGTVAPDQLFRVVEVSGGGEGDVRAVSAFVTAVESGEPLTAFRSFAVEQSQPAAEESRAERLRVSFVIRALALTQRSGAS